MNSAARRQNRATLCRQVLECGSHLCSEHRSAIPTGLWPPAQGCEERATLGTPRQRSTTPTGLRRHWVFPSHGAATLSGLYSSSSFPQGSSLLATLGFVPESL